MARAHSFLVSFKPFNSSLSLRLSLLLPHLLLSELPSVFSSESFELHHRNFLLPDRSRPSTPRRAAEPHNYCVSPSEKAIDSIRTSPVSPDPKTTNARDSRIRILEPKSRTEKEDLGVERKDKDFSKRKLRCDKFNPGRAYFTRKPTTNKRRNRGNPGVPPIFLSRLHIRRNPIRFRTFALPKRDCRLAITIRKGNKKMARDRSSSFSSFKSTSSTLSNAWNAFVELFSWLPGGVTGTVDTTTATVLRSKYTGDEDLLDVEGWEEADLLWRGVVVGGGVTSFV